MNGRHSEKPALFAARVPVTEIMYVMKCINKGTAVAWWLR